MAALIPHSIAFPACAAWGVALREIEASATIPAQLDFLTMRPSI